MFAIHDEVRAVPPRAFRLITRTHGAEPAEHAPRSTNAPHPKGTSERTGKVGTLGKRLAVLVAPRSGVPRQLRLRSVPGGHSGRIKGANGKTRAGNLVARFWGREPLCQTGTAHASTHQLVGMAFAVCNLRGQGESENVWENVSSQLVRPASENERTHEYSPLPYRLQSQSARQAKVR